MIDIPRKSLIEALLFSEGALQAPDIRLSPHRIRLPDTTTVKVHQVGPAVCIQQNVTYIEVCVVDPIAVKVSQHFGDSHNLRVCEFPLAQNLKQV